MAQTINLNIIPKGIPDVVNVSQFDVGRVIQFALYDGVNVYTIPSGATVTIAGRKGDNHIFIYEATIAEGRHAVSIETTEQMTAWAGENLCQLRITKTGIDIATVNFRMMVQERPDANGDISDSDLPMIVALATEQELNAEAWAVGTKNGTAVASTDPQYHNNSKYYKEQAATSATNAAASEVAAAASADHADATAADVDEAVQAVEGVVDTTYGMQDSLSIDVDGNPIEGYFAGAPANALTVDIKPTQNLNGYDYPWVGGSRKNKAQFTNNNMDSYHATFNSRTDNTVEFTASGSYSRAKYKFTTEVGKTYTVSFKGYSTGALRKVNFADTFSDWSATYGSITLQTSDDSYSFTFTATTTVLSVIFYNTTSGTTGVMSIYDFQLEEGSAKTSFMPYANECPITGIAMFDANTKSRNMFMGNSDESAQYVGNYYINDVNSDYSKSSNSNYNCFNVEVDANTEYCMSIQDTNLSTRGQIRYLDSSKNLLSGDTVGYSARYSTFTTPNNCAYIEFSISKLSRYNTLCVNVSDSNFNGQYEPYGNNHCAVDLDETRYGAFLNTKSGELTVSEILKEYDGSEDESWYPNGSGNSFYMIALSDVSYVSGGKTCFSNEFETLADTTQWATISTSDNICTITKDGSNNRLAVAYKKVADVTEFKAFLANKPLQVCYKLATPVTVQLDPAVLNLLKGYNHITSNGNTVMHLSAVPEKLINYIVNAFGTDESGRTTASRSYTAKEYFYKDGFMYKVTTAIAQGAAFTVGTNCVQTTIFAELTALNG